MVAKILSGFGPCCTGLAAWSKSHSSRCIAQLRRMTVKTGSGTSRIRSAPNKGRKADSNSGVSRGGAGPDNSNMAEQRADEHRREQDNNSSGQAPRRRAGARSTADNYADAQPLLPVRKLFLLQASSTQLRHGAYRNSLSCSDNAQRHHVMPSLRRDLPNHPPAGAGGPTCPAKPDGVSRFAKRGGTFC
jgi:hypothetical protein